MSEQNSLIKHDLIPKNSSFITKIEYSYFMRGETRMAERITISFKNGEITEYLLGEKTWNAFNAADSVGKYFHANIKGKDGISYNVIKRKNL